jgi:hypothetical protein
MEGQIRLRFHMLVLVALLALVLGAAACGDSDDDGGGDANASAQSKRGVDPADFAKTPDGQLRLSYARFVDAFYKGDSEMACDMLTSGMQKKLAAEMRKRKTCEARLDLHFKTGGKLTKERPRILRIKFNGSRAMALTQVKGSARYPIPFARERGEWRVAGGWSNG